MTQRYRRILSLFDIILDNIWSESDNIAFYGPEGDIKMFENQLALYASNRYYDSHVHWVVPENWQEILKSKCELLGLEVTYTDYPVEETLQSEETVANNELICENPEN